MPLRRFKPGYFILEGLNSFATVYYFYYFYFFMQQEYGFGNGANLALAALNGAIYTVCAWLGGIYAQRYGYFLALKLGFALMLAALAVGTQVTTASGQILTMSVTVVGMCFTWPTLEALVSEGETVTGLPRMVGIYNMVWAGTAALAYFTGGAMLEQFGLKSLFYVPIAIQLCQLALTMRLEAKARQTMERHAAEQASRPPPASLGVEPGLRPMAEARLFLNMAWLANPFAYVAINTLIAAMPGVAQRLALSTMVAGFCCSIWCFSRLAAFVVLWQWTGWHYRFGWLLGSYLALVGAFSVILLAPNVAVLVVAQVIFGAAAGLVYYSSLFYSMDAGDTKGEHGGIHEAAIGLGNFAGPAVGAASLWLLPQYADKGTLAVSGLLVLGLGGLVAMRRRGVESRGVISGQ